MSNTMPRPAMQAVQAAALVEKEAASLYDPHAEVTLLRQTLRRFVEEEVEPQVLEYDRAEKFNRQLFDRMAELGLLGVTIPEADGGAGMGALESVVICEELSSSDPSMAMSYLAHSILFVNNFYHNANAEQRQRYLPRSLSGECVGGMAMTEPGGGTDVLGMQTQARRQGDKYLLNGRKMWITNGYTAEGEPGDLFLVYAKTGDKLSTFVVERHFPGFALGQMIKDKTGMRASPTAELVFEDCEVPVTNRLGEEGDSILHMMQNLEIERMVLAGMALGMARRCVDAMTRYAGERKAFGQPINAFGQIQRYIADSYTAFLAGRAMTYDIARRMNLKKPGQRIETDAAKLYTATMAKQVADNAMQVLGGYGYVAESRVELMWRCAKLLEIGGGTLEAHQKNITRDLSRTPQFYA